jgi:hypothetical protein
MCRSGGIAPLFLTSALMEASGQLHAPSALPLGEEPPVPIVYEAGWAPEPVWTLWRREKTFPCRESNLGCPTHSQSLYRRRYGVMGCIRKSVWRERYHWLDVRYVHTPNWSSFESRGQTFTPASLSGQQGSDLGPNTRYLVVLLSSFSHAYLFLYPSHPIIRF